MSELMLVLVIAVVWLAALVMLTGLCASAKTGDRTRITTGAGDAHGPPRAERSASLVYSRRRARAQRLRARHAARAHDRN